MVSVEQWAEIRRMQFVEGLSIREIARRTGLHRETIRRALRSAAPPSYRAAARGRRSSIRSRTRCTGCCARTRGCPVSGSARC